MFLKSSRRGMTLVEMMIVVGIIVVLVSMAMPTYTKIRSDTKAGICKSNLKQIDAAIERWAFEKEVLDGTALTPYESEIYAYIKNGKPSCPSGGSYILYNLSDAEQVRCSSGVEGHKYP